MSDPAQVAEGGGSTARRRMGWQVVAAAVLLIAWNLFLVWMAYGT